LLEQEICGHNIQIAIECRDRSRPGTIEWLDGLIGKFKDLPVNKVIAVSSSGFTNGMVEKASANGIELRSFEKALDSDWQAEFIQLGVGSLDIETTIVSFELELDPPVLDIDDDPQFLYVKSTGEPIEISKLVAELQDTHCEELKPRFSEYYKTKDDFGKVCITERNTGLRGLMFKDIDETEHAVVSIRSICHTVVRATEAIGERFRFNDALISRFGLAFRDGEKRAFTLVQFKHDSKGEMKSPSNKSPKA